MPQPEIRPAKQSTDIGIIYFGTTTASAEEALDILSEKSIHMDALRVRGFPFNADVESFIEEHDQIFVVEQNRDGQLRTMLINECEINPRKLKPLLCFDGLPVTARWIVDGIIGNEKTNNVIPLSKEVTV